MLQVHVKTALSSLRVQKLRAFLAMLGVLIGAASVVALVSSGQLASLHATEQFRALGTNLLAVSINTPHQSTASNPDNKLSLANIQELEKAIPDILNAAPYIRLYSPFSYKGKQIRGDTIATTKSMRTILKLDMASGRFISSLDHHNYYCVIGAEIAKRLKKHGVFDPLGTQLRLGNRYFQIIGIAKPWPENMFFYANLNKAIIVPIELADQLSEFATIRNILFRATRGKTASIQPLITQQIKRHFPKARLFFHSPKEIIKRMKQQQQSFTWLLALIGSVSLLVGGIGIMNIMLVSVIERKREIGVRLAIGARACDIQWMFLCEATVLTLLGGTLGVILGLTLSFIIATLAGWTFHLLQLPILLGFVTSVLVGLFFGFYPARKASRLDPIQALRTE